MPDTTALEALPPSVGDAAVAVVLLRDLAADLTTAPQPGGVDPAAVDVDDAGRFHLRPTTPVTATDPQHAPLAAPELFRGEDPSGRSDVYAAACLALTRYLGGSPVPASVLGQRTGSATRLGAQRQAQRTLPARLGALPAPFRGTFARAVAKEPHLRPTPAALLADLDAAIAATGGDAAARTRVHRLVVLARVFEPGTGSLLRVPTAAAVAAVPAPAPLDLPIRPLPSLRPTPRTARVALIAAVTVLATGGVAVAAVVGLGGGTAPRPQALETIVQPSTTSGPSVEPTTAVTPVAVVTSDAPVAAASGGTGGGSGTGRSGSGGSGSGGSGSGGSGSGSGTTRHGSSGSGGGSSSGGGSQAGGGSSTVPGTIVDPPPGSDPGTPPPVNTDPPTPPTSEPPSSEPPTSEPPTSEPPTSDPPTSPESTPTFTAEPSPTPSG